MICKNIRQFDTDIQCFLIIFIIKFERSHYLFIKVTQVATAKIYNFENKTLKMSFFYCFFFRELRPVSFVKFQQSYYIYAYRSKLQISKIISNAGSIL